MMDLSDYPHPAISGVNIESIERSAVHAARELRERGYVLIELEPDDGTRYEIVIAARASRTSYTGPRYVVANNFSPVHPWNGNPSVHPDYASEKWGGPNHNSWTGVVMALLLNATARNLRGEGA